MKKYLTLFAFMAMTCHSDVGLNFDEEGHLIYPDDTLGRL